MEQDTTLELKVSARELLGMKVTRLRREGVIPAHDTGLSLKSVDTRRFKVSLFRIPTPNNSRRDATQTRYRRQGTRAWKLSS